MMTFLKNTTLDGFGKTLNRTFRTLLLERWRTAGDVMNALVTPSGQCKFENHHYLWPFPQSEMDINPNLDQKPVYK